MVVSKSKISYIWDIINGRCKGYHEDYEPSVAENFMASYIDTANIASFLASKKLPSSIHYLMTREKLEGSYRKKNHFQKNIVEEKSQDEELIINAISFLHSVNRLEAQKLIIYFTKEQIDNMKVTYEKIIKNV